MDWMYLFYFFLAALLFYGARGAGRGNWNEGFTSLEQTKILQGIAALGVALILTTNHRGIGFYRTVYYIPSLLGGSVEMFTGMPQGSSSQAFCRLLLHCADTRALLTRICST